MTEKSTSANNKVVRYESVDALPSAPPLSAAFKAMSDEEAELRALDDPDAGIIPNGFWDNAVLLSYVDAKQQKVR